MIWIIASLPDRLGSLLHNMNRVIYFIAFAALFVPQSGESWNKGIPDFFGYLDQTHAHTYSPSYLWRDGKRVDIVGNQNGKREAYSHDLFVEYALDFIRRHKDQTFFFYGAFTIPHAEVTVPEDSLAEYRGRWPNKIAAGSTTDHVSDFADMLPTFADIVGTPSPEGLDGVSILPTLLGQSRSQKTREYHYREAAPAQALRQGDWKIYRDAPGEPTELYNLRLDLGETHDVSNEHPEIVARLGQLMAQAHVESPDFPLKPKKQKNN
ncbi:MAG: sulfatase/phosphatase domain-containing protein [Pirellula sp.]